MILFNEVSKEFQTKAGKIQGLNHVNLHIPKGDIFGIIGMSGGGKSTLIRSINYLEHPTSGEVVIDGCSLAGLSKRELREMRKEIGMIFQHFNLLMQKNVLDNVCFAMKIAGTGDAEAKKRARELLKLVGLADREKAYPAQLSGGQKQRVAIARAIANHPKILLCDEATSALDPKTTKSVLELLKQINRDYGITIVVVTHEMSVVREVCSRVAILDEGRLAETGSVDEIFTAPKSAQARSLIAGNDGMQRRDSWKEENPDAGRGKEYVFI